MAALISKTVAVKVEIGCRKRQEINRGELRRSAFGKPAYSIDVLVSFCFLELSSVVPCVFPH